MRTHAGSGLGLSSLTLRSGGVGCVDLWDPRRPPRGGKHPLPEPALWPPPLCKVRPEAARSPAVACLERDRGRAAGGRRKSSRRKDCQDCQDCQNCPECQDCQDCRERKTKEHCAAASSLSILDAEGDGGSRMFFPSATCTAEVKSVFNRGSKPCRESMSTCSPVSDMPGQPPTYTWWYSKTRGGNGATIIVQPRLQACGDSTMTQTA